MMNMAHFKVLFTTLITGISILACSKDDDVAPVSPVNPEPETPIVELTDYSTAINDYVATKHIFVLQYKLSNLDGFMIPDTVKQLLSGETIKFTDGGSASISADRKFIVKGNMANEALIRMLNTMERSMVSDDVVSESITVYGKWTNPQNPDTTIYTMFRNDRIWIGLFNYNSGEQYEEYWSSEGFTDKTIPYHAAYGISGLIPLNKFTTNTVSKDYFVLQTKESNRIIFWKENGRVIAFNGLVSIWNWYDDSYFVSSDKAYRVIKKDGEIVIDFAAYNPFPTIYYHVKNVIPISYKECLEIQYNHIEKRDITQQQSSWFVNTPFEAMNDAKYTYNLIHIEGNIYTFEGSMTQVDGSTNKIIFNIDIDNGYLEKIE